MDIVLRPPSTSESIGTTTRGGKGLPFYEDRYDVSMQLSDFIVAASKQSHFHFWYYSCAFPKRLRDQENLGDGTILLLPYTSEYAIAKHGRREQPF